MIVRPAKGFLRGIGFLAAVLVLLEVGFRILAYFPHDTRLYVNDPHTGHRVRASVMFGPNRTNSRGFNDTPHALRKRPGTSRVAVLGDSYVWGPGIARSENLVTIMQQKARENRKGIELFNMGIPGAGPRAYLGLVQTDVLQMNVDVACVLIYVGNDIVDAHPDLRNKVWLGQPRNVLRAQYIVGLSSEYYYSYRLFRFAFRFARERLASPSERPGNAAYTYENFLSIHRAHIRLHLREPSRFIRQSYDGIAAILKELKRASVEGNIAVMIVLAPHELQVNDSLRETVLRRYEPVDTYLDLSRPQRLLRRILRAADLPYVDLYPRFVEAAQTQKLYLTQDTHWNRAGHALAAKIIWEKLAVYGFV
jgi:hypothetical protein